MESRRKKDILDKLSDGAQINNVDVVDTLNIIHSEIDKEELDLKDKLIDMELEELRLYLNLH